MKKLILITSILFLTGCSSISSFFTLDSDKQLNLQNLKAAKIILEHKEATPNIKSIAKDIQKNSEQLGKSSVGLPDDLSIPYTPENSKAYRKESEEKNKNNWIDTLLQILTSANLPYAGILLALLAWWRQIRKTYREKGIKEALFDGVDKVLKVANDKSAKKIKELLRSEAAAHNIAKEIKSDLKARK